VCSQEEADLVKSTYIFNSSKLLSTVSKVTTLTHCASFVLFIGSTHCSLEFSVEHAFDKLALHVVAVVDVHFIFDKYLVF